MHTASEIEPLFDPKRIAFIGASEDSPRFMSMYDNLRTYGSDDRERYFVNPNRDSVLGERCYDSIGDVPGRVDLCVIIVPAQVVLTVFKECCRADVRTAIIVSAGFAETGEEGREREQRLLELSEKYELPFCGPNTYGGLSTHDSAAPIQASTLDFDAGNVGAVLQSGGLLNQILYSGIERGFGFSKVVDSGNEASITTADYVNHMLEDEQTDVILGIVEGFNDPKRFLEIADKAVEMRKPLVVLKIARSEKGGEIAESHTGAITAPDDVVVAALAQHGVVQVESLDMLIEMGELFSKVKHLSGNNVGIIEISGGGCALFSDAVAETELELPPLSNETVDAVEECLPPIGVARNPVDMAMGWGADMMDEAHSGVLEALDGQPEIDVIVSRLSIPQDGSVDTASERLETIQRIEQESESTFAVISRTSGRVSDEWTERVRSTDIPFLQEYHKGIRALDHLWRYSKFTDTKRPDPKATASAVPDHFEAESGVVTEHRAKLILKEIGLEMPAERIVTSEDEAVDAARSIGFPIALKIVSPAIPHKTDIGGVETGLKTPEDVRRCYDEITTATTDRRANAEIEGVLVQEMIGDGVEMLIGSKRSPFGQAVVIGIGGVFTEIVDDTSIRIAPFAPSEAEEMLRELGGYELLTGARGDEPAAIRELSTTIATFSEFVAANEAIVETDLNPVIVTPEDAYVVDALFQVDSE